MRVTISDSYVEDIHYVDTYRHKYDKAITEYIDVVVMGRGVGFHEETGDVDWAEFVGRIGRRIVFYDDRGFVTSERYSTVDAARARFAEINDAYNEWMERDEIDGEFDSIVRFMENGETTE